MIKIIRTKGKTKLLKKLKRSTPHKLRLELDLKKVIRKMQI